MVVMSPGHLNAILCLPRRSVPNRQCRCVVTVLLVCGKGLTLALGGHFRGRCHRSSVPLFC
eukprot:9112690-Karenia_brevis.AAC.2